MALSSFPRLSDYVFAERVGGGSYATVFKAFRKGDGKRAVVAVKCVQISSLSKEAVDNLLTEISLLKKIKHPHIVNMIDFQWNERHIFIIMEFCSGGDLSHFIRTRRSLPERIVKMFLQQIASALQFLNKENICHMDLKPQNILLTSHHNPILKLADFGFAQYLTPNDLSTSLRGSPLYMAPEMLLKREYDSRVDLWSVGVILYECLFGRAPYSSKSFAELADKIEDPRPIEIPYGVQLSDKCRDLLTRLLKRDPDQRITFKEFFGHPFLDLEHVPSAESYDKAVEQLANAVKDDEKKEYVSAVHLYCNGLQHLVAAIQYEKDSERKDQMRQRARQYMARAETIKQILKPSGNEKNSEFNEFEEEVKCCPKLQETMIIRNEAEKLAEEEKLETALEKYLVAIDSLLSIIQAEPTGKKKDFLTVQVRNWMDRAERIKQFLNVRIPKEVEDDEIHKDEVTQGKGQFNCFIQ